VTVDETRAFLAAYDAVLAQWPVPVRAVDVASAYGTTRVNVCGPEDGHPLVLLHADGATSTVWFANVADLARRHRVFAIDSAGRSRHDGAPFRRLDDLMAWLDAMFVGLDLGRAALVGHSYGGWTALNYALRAPERVRKLALLDPTECFAGLRLTYRLRAVPLFVRPSARRMREFISWETGGIPIDPAWLRVTALEAERPRSRIVMPRRPPAERLAGFAVPTLVVLAENSRSHDIHQVQANARRLLPDVVTTTLAGQTHHTIPTHNAEALNRVLLEFLG
jgi:pimeloyl-ACP methyl ester carboxylesterase